MIKLAVKGKLVEMSDDELERRFSPGALNGVDRFKLMNALAEQPKQVPKLMKDLGINPSKGSNTDYGRVRYSLNQLYKEGIVGKHKVNAKTVLWYLTDKGLRTLEKR